MFRENVTSIMQSVHHIRRTDKALIRGLDLESLITILKDDEKWKNGETDSMVLIKNSSRSVVLAISHENTELIFESIQKSIIFQVIEGHLEIHLQNNEDFNLRSGQTLTIDEPEFNIDSVKETAFLMFMNC